MNMKVENEMALPITKSVTVMLLEPYAGKLARTVLRGESSRKGADLLDSSGDPDTSKTAASWFGACIFQYLFIFAGGLLAVFVVFVILYMAGVDQWVCIAFGVAAASVLVWLTFRLNTRYGEHGLMKLLAARRHPRYLLNRKSLRRLLKRKGGRV